MLKLTIFTLLLSFCSCHKPSNDISELALECFKQKKAIRIEFIPHPESKSDLDEQESK